MKNHDCTTCLWEYMCDWSGEECRYVPEKVRYGMAKLEEKIEAYIKTYQKPPYGREVEGTVELLEECKNAIRMCTAHRWTPVKKRPPRDGEEVLAYFRYEPQSPDIICQNKYLGSGRWLSEQDRVLAWMPLPEPYRQEEETDG